ncbi:MAG: hypothetical protein KF795_02405 [Labilithrix sp.]|nr:hypothetical protein [Labilithrix sp.]
MAEPTLKDVLGAIARMQGELSEVRREMATKSELAAVRAEVAAHRKETAAHRKETAKGFEDLDKELAKHADPVHRKLEARIERLEKRAAPKKVTPRPLRRR